MGPGGEVREEPGGDQQAAEAGVREEGGNVRRGGKGEEQGEDPAEDRGGGGKQEGAERGGGGRVRQEGEERSRNAIGRTSAVMRRRVLILWSWNEGEKHGTMSETGCCVRSCG